MKTGITFDDVYLMIIDKKDFSLYVIENRVYNEKHETLIYTLLNTFNGKNIEVNHRDLYNEDLYERKVVGKFAIQQYG